MDKRKETKAQKAKVNRAIALFLLIAVCLGGIAVYALVSDSSPRGTDKTSKSDQSEETVAAVASPQSDYQRVINRSYPIPRDYIAGTGTLATVEGDIEMESQAAEAVKKMVADLRADGMDIVVQSGYRSDDTQEELYQNQIAKHNGNELEAATISAVPLTSEHQAGLAVDFSVDGKLDQNFANTPQGKWLNQHCTEYGFILRYTKDKVEFTGIIWEPWHFRYVGSPEIAQAITESGKSMEEYYGQYLKAQDLDQYLPYLQ